MSRTWTDSQTLAITARGKTLLVSAAAGSGKTSVLTERIIRTLTDPQNPADLSRILVVTFTRAAAAELKGRIAEALSNALAENPGNTHLSEQLLKLGSAQISTIDSFFQKLVRANFEKLGLTATFRPADESEILPLSVEILDGLIAEYYDRYAEDRTSESSIKSIQTNRFAQALDHLLSNRSDGKLYETLLDFYSDFSSYAEGIELLVSNAEQLRNMEQQDFLDTRYGALYLEYFKPLFAGYLKELDELERNMEYDPFVHQKCCSLLSSDRLFCELVLEGLEAKDYHRVQAAANAFYAGRFPTLKENRIAESDAYQLWRKQFRKNGVTKLQECFKYSVEEIREHALRTADFCDIMYLFYRDYEARLMTEKNLRGILEYNDVRSMVYRLLTDSSGNASSFADSLAEQYDAVYIDEYQDVDSIQDKIFSLIGRNRRFMVGDIKQSIYGFRGSDPSIFAGYRRVLPLYGSEGAENADGNSIFMSENFRCDKPVITFTNRVCSFLFSACEQSIGYRPHDDLRHSKLLPEKAPEGYPFPVQMAVFEKASGEDDSEDNDGEYNQEAAWVAAEISRLLREGVLDNGKPICASDIAILVRSKKHGKGVTRALKMLSIPVSSEQSTDFVHDPLLVEFLNLLRCIDNPYRDLPLSEFLLSRAGGFLLSELSEIRHASNTSYALFDALREAGEKNLLPHLTEKITQMLRWLEKWRSQAAVLPADRLIRLLLLDERWVEVSSEPPLLMIYEQARLYQRSSWSALYGFLSHIEKLIDGEKISAAGFAKAENAVTVMTIHHSKGLEFPVVFLVSCGSQFNEMDSRESLIFHHQTGVATKLYNSQTAEHDNTALREASILAVKMEQHEENIRTLYVALSRARERLYVSGTLRGKWENMLANASCVRRDNRSEILTCSSYLEWFMAAMCDAQRQNEEFPCIFRHFLPDEWDNGVPLEKFELATLSTTAGDLENSEAYASLIRNQEHFEYPLRVLHGLPTKAAASKLKRGLLDSFLEASETEEQIEQQINLMSSHVPTFDYLLSDKKRATAADIGTATHAFLEFCDYKQLLQNGALAEKNRLVAERFMRQETADLVDDEKIKAFCSSELMRLIRQAKTVYREQKFSILVPMNSLTEDQEFAARLEGHSLYVQGSIDLILELSDGTLILVDYKTDRVAQKELVHRALLAERMRATHGTQLSYYAEAVEQLFGKKPDKTCLYLVSLGDMIEI